MRNLPRFRDSALDANPDVDQLISLSRYAPKTEVARVDVRVVRPTEREVVSDAPDATNFDGLVQCDDVGRNVGEADGGDAAVVDPRRGRDKAGGRVDTDDGLRNLQR